VRNKGVGCRGTGFGIRPARRGAVTLAHLAGALALLLCKHHLDAAAIQVATIHVIGRVTCLVVVGELDESKWFRAPKEEGTGGEVEEVRGNGGALEAVQMRAVVGMREVMCMRALDARGTEGKRARIANVGNGPRCHRGSGTPLVTLP
jgi:hypothetical protein